MSWFRLTIHSLLNRKLPSALLIISIALSGMLLIGVQKIKDSAKQGFSHSISGTDLIVGARSGSIQLLLYTVFRQGQPIANMSWDSIQNIQQLPTVEWVIPISLGDSHRGFPVVGTTRTYFDHYKYGKKQPLSIQKGTKFNAPLTAVIGANVAKKLRYKINSKIQLAHGMGVQNLPIHKNNTFTIVGILEPTGTPVDNSIHIPLEGITKLHLPASQSKSKVDLTPQSVTGAFIGLTSNVAIFSTQRTITQWQKEPLMAIIPGIALSQLWRNISNVDTAFFIITILVVVIAFIGLLLGLFMSINQRSREISILRVMGAHPIQIAAMLITEAFVITVSGVIIGGILSFGLGQALSPIIEARTGLILTINQPSTTEISLAIGIILFGALISLIPAILAYKKSKTGGFISL
ncbi:MAG: ABC transporter permease [Candidatus Marinamargulisbacteria bacterium]